MNNNFYIYFHTKLTNDEVFYVGKGKDKRAWSKRGRSQYWNRIKNKYGYIIHIVEKDLTEEKAFEREKYWIEYFGKENLVNMTDGGQGVSGLIFSKEHKKKLSEKTTSYRLGKKHSEETKKKMSESQKGCQKHSEESRKKLSELAKGNKYSLGLKRSEETKKKISESIKLYYQNKKSKINN
jgi:hypothetical protein